MPTYKARTPYPVGGLKAVRTGSTIIVTWQPCASGKEGTGLDNVDTFIDKFPYNFNGDYLVNDETVTETSKVFDTVTALTVTVKARKNGYMSTPVPVEVGTDDGEYFESFVKNACKSQKSIAMILQRRNDMTINVKNQAHYPLEEVKRLVKERAVIVSRHNALYPAFELGFSRELIYECMLQLTPRNLLKSTEDWREKGLWQDAYRTSLEGEEVYIKLQVRLLGEQKVIVTSFHKYEREEF